MTWLPILFIGLIVLFYAMSIRLRKQAEAQSAAAREAKRAAEPKAEERTEPARKDARFVSQQRGVRAADAVQEYEMHRAAAGRKSVASTMKSAESERPAEERQKEQTVPLLTWDRNSAMQGILYAEILGKPKALRR